MDAQRSPMGVVGVETEYAIGDEADPHANPIALSHEVIAAAGEGPLEHVRWDYSGEDPLSDARGSHLLRANADPSLLTDSPQLQATNRVQRNGARIYVDHAHPEYSAPETLGPFAALAYDRAGDALMERAARKASERTGRRIILHRNNTDGKGASWGAHENYQVPRSTPFPLLGELFTIHAATRQIYTGAGRVGLGEKSEDAGFQLSQRADFFHKRVGLQTTFERPIVNTRDEPHSTDRWRRFHVIVGDANRMDVPEVLKLGTTSMVLWLAGALGEAGIDPQEVIDELMPADPVAALHLVSRDLTLREPYETVGGGRMTAWQAQLRLRSITFAAAAQIWGATSKGDPLWPDEGTRRVMDMWGEALGDLAQVMRADDETRLTLAGPASRLEWLLKWQLLESLRRRRGAAWDDVRLAALDISWARLGGGSVWARLAPRAQALADPAQVARAEATPPADTRAWLRGSLAARVPGSLAALGWESVTLLDSHGRAHRIDCRDTLSHTQDKDGAALDALDSSPAGIDRLIAALESPAAR